jgi:glycosyltransferase involved in cell wall biosynthesis
MPELSIIIPVHNAESTLERCVSSVRAQSYYDWELILVDDGSVDNSLELCSRISETDSRIRVLSETHCGVSSARNLALDHVQGRYLCFIDADDHIEPDYLAELSRFKDYDLVLCGYFVDRYDNLGTYIGQQVFRPVDLDVSSIYDRTLLVPLFLKGMIHLNCNKLLHSDIVQQYRIRYSDIPINEDYDFMLRYLEHCQSIKTIPAALYHWTRITGKETGASTFSFDYVNLYNDAHLLTARYFGNRILAGQIMFHSYYWLILKYLQQIKNKNADYRDLDVLMKNVLLKEAFQFHKPVSRGEALMNSLLTHRSYRLFFLLNRLLQQ